jgi:hypothetical protein
MKMGLSSEMKNLSEEMLASFKQRIKENEELVTDVQKTLDGFRKDHQEMTTALRAGLDKGEKTRLHEANILMNELIKDHKEMALLLRTGLDEDEKARLMEADILMKKMIKEHTEMTAALRAKLDKDEKTRMKEFVAIMKSINEKISEIFTYTDDLLVRFDKEHQDMAVALKAGLDKDEINRLKEFVALMKNINEEISEIFTYTHSLLEKSEVERLEEFAILIKSISEEVLRIFAYTHNMLAKFDKEHMEMSVELRKNLSDGEVERIKEFNVVMTGIRNDVKSLKKSVAELLGDYAQDREGASAAWKKMSDILAQLRTTAVAPPKQAVKKEVKPAPVVVVEAVEAIEASPVVIEEETPVAVEVKPLVTMTLEEKVLDYINKHPKGLRISEMEQPLGETRMKLGFVAKALLEEGKVQKLDNLYFPIK